jgi:hypothetical protein
MATTAAEQAKTRSDLAQLAGMGPFSLGATLGGVLVGYAMSALLIAGAAAVLQHNDSSIDLTQPWVGIGTKGGLLLGGLLFVSYALAGYVAGRMAWRRGWLHGVAVFVGSVVIVGAVALLVRSLNKPDDVEKISDALRSFGIPTTRDEWRDVGSFVGLASLGGMLLGSLAGGLLGERWFTKVSRRALEAEVDVRDRMAATNERLAPVHNGNGQATNVHDDDVDVDSMTKDELYELAQELDIAGRSNMTKEELARSVRKGMRALERQK